MIDIKGFFSTDEVKIGAGVAAGIYATEFAATLLKKYVEQVTKTDNPTMNLVIGVLLKGLVGAALYNFGKENLFVRYMAIGAMSSIVLDVIRFALPSAQSLAMQMVGGGAQPITIVTPQNIIQKKIPQPIA